MGNAFKSRTNALQWPREKNMRNLLLASCPIMLWVIVLIHALFITITFKSYSKTRNLLFLFSGLIICGLFYDALILALGTVLKEGAFLRTISQLRFVSHGALIPLIFALCAESLQLKGLAKKIVYGLTAVLVVLGIAEGFATDLEVRSIANIVRYASSDATPAWASMVSSLLSYGTVVPLMIVGIVVWVKEKTPTLFLSGFLMFAFSALGPATGNFDLIFYISMYGEVLMALFFYLYAKRKTSKN